jgi:AcrR family transcriptional regulator
MRSLPGRASRTSLGESSSTLTRDGVKDDQRRRILRALGELVAKRGYETVTVALIVKRGRVSYKTFYNHFSNKDECFLALFDEAFAVTERSVRDSLAAEPEAPWPRQVAIALRAFFELIAAEPLIARACIVEAPTAGPIVLERYERARKAFVPLIRAGRKFNPKAAELPKTLEDTLAGSLLWSAFQRLISGEVDRIEELLPETIELVLRPYLGERQAVEATREALAEAEPL